MRGVGVLSARCVCEEFATGRLNVNIHRDPADDTVERVELRHVPQRFAVSGRMADKLNAQVPGMVTFEKRRMVLRGGGREYAFNRVGRCEACGLTLLERA